MSTTHPENRDLTVLLRQTAAKIEGGASVEDMDLVQLLMKSASKLLEKIQKNGQMENLLRKGEIDEAAIEPDNRKENTETEHKQTVNREFAKVILNRVKEGCPESGLFRPDIISSDTPYLPFSISGSKGGNEISIQEDNHRLKVNQNEATRAKVEEFQNYSEEIRLLFKSGDPTQVESFIQLMQLSCPDIYDTEQNDPGSALGSIPVIRFDENGELHISSIETPTPGSVTPEEQSAANKLSSLLIKDIRRHFFNWYRDMVAEYLARRTIAEGDPYNPNFADSTVPKDNRGDEYKRAGDLMHQKGFHMKRITGVMGGESRGKTTFNQNIYQYVADLKPERVINLKQRFNGLRLKLPEGLIPKFSRIILTENEQQEGNTDARDINLIQTNTIRTIKGRNPRDLSREIIKGLETQIDPDVISIELPATFTRNEGMPPSIQNQIDLSKFSGMHTDAFMMSSMFLSLLANGNMDRAVHMVNPGDLKELSSRLRELKEYMHWKSNGKESRFAKTNYDVGLMHVFYNIYKTLPPPIRPAVFFSGIFRLPVDTLSSNRLDNSKLSPAVVPNENIWSNTLLKDVPNMSEREIAINDLPDVAENYRQRDSLSLAVRLGLAEAYLMTEDGEGGYEFVERDKIFSNRRRERYFPGIPDLPRNRKYNTSYSPLIHLGEYVEKILSDGNPNKSPLLNTLVGLISEMRVPVYEGEIRQHKREEVERRKQAQQQ